MFNTLIEAFNEDRDTITAQFKNLTENAEHEMLPLHFDSALIRFRKMLADAVQVEKNSAPHTIVKFHK